MTCDDTDIDYTVGNILVNLPVGWSRSSRFQVALCKLKSIEPVVEKCVVQTANDDRKDNSQAVANVHVSFYAL